MIRKIYFISRQANIMPAA